MKKVISFSIWGNEYRYLGGALQNVELAKYFYPDWICRFYIGASTNDSFVDKLNSNNNVEIVKMDEMGDYKGMVWRFLCVSDGDIDISIIRDADSRLHEREVTLVNQWINSPKKFHIIRDHKFHTAKIMGGMWGSKKGTIDNMHSLLKEYNLGNYWQTDQNFLRDIIYPKVKNISMTHDFFGVVDGNCPFPNSLKNRDENHFIGQAYDGNGKVLDKNIHFDDFIDNIKLEKNGEFKR